MACVGGMGIMSATEHPQFMALDDLAHHQVIGAVVTDMSRKARLFAAP
jgi:hypothetical protein